MNRSAVRPRGLRTIMGRAAVGVVAVSTLMVGLAPPASAQATRTWVSGVGNDANPCSRTAPCQTFFGALGKTATGGVISVLDSGGFGAVTINKSITIDGTGANASLLVGGVNAITINAPASADVTLRELDIVSTPGSTDTTCGSPTGISILGARSVRIDDTRISGFTNAVDTRLTTSSADIFVDIALDRVAINDSCAHGVRVVPAGGAIHSMCGNRVAGNAEDGASTDHVGCDTVPAPAPPVDQNIPPRVQVRVGTKVSIVLGR